MLMLYLIDLISLFTIKQD
uniref:Uncharacterized protein n=1 Tax=Rhizophora mucronata TaxID=61149 RepID=A0A2P2MBL9_RHIMU